MGGNGRGQGTGLPRRRGGAACEEVVAGPSGEARSGDHRGVGRGGASPDIGGLSSSKSASIAAELARIGLMVAGMSYRCSVESIAEGTDWHCACRGWGVPRPVESALATIEARAGRRRCLSQAACRLLDSAADVEGLVAAEKRALATIEARPGCSIV